MQIIDFKVVGQTNGDSASAEMKQILESSGLDPLETGDFKLSAAVE